MMRIVLIQIAILISGSVFGLSTWTQRADFPGGGRHRGTAIAIGNKGYMGLGHYNGAGPNIVKKDWWEYDLATNSWSQKADYIGGSASGAYAVLAFGIGNYGFVGGGQTASNANFYKYDPSVNTWTQVSSMPTIALNTQGFVIGNKGYYLSSSQLYEYDALLDQWATKNPAPFSVSTWNSTFTIDNKGYVKSGLSLWEYKPTTDTWINRATFPGLATGGSVGFSEYGKGYIVAGYAGWLSEVNSEVWEYDPGTNQWTPRQEFEGTSRRFASAFQVGDHAFIGNGTNGTNFSDLWEFNAIAGLDNDEEFQFSCYPNPATTITTVQSSGASNFELICTDLSGKVICELNTTNGQIVIERNNLPSGTYYYHIIKDNKRIKTDKFIFI